MVITERSQKVVKTVRLGILMMQWFAKSLENCLKGKKRTFTALHGREPKASLRRDAPMPVVGTWH